jgi:hypothetical protein
MAGRRTAEALKAKGYNRFVFSLATGIATAAFSIKRWHTLVWLWRDDKPN